MKRGAIAVAGAALALATASCAIISGLSDLDIDEGTDASIADATGGDVVVTPDAGVDAITDASLDQKPPPPDVVVIDASVDAPQDAVVEVSGPTIQCGSSTCSTSSLCCHSPQGQSFTCLADASACGPQTYAVKCDAKSCGFGQVCCVNTQNGIGLGAACTFLCSQPNTRLCQPDGAACQAPYPTCGPSQLTFPPYDICK